MSQQSLHVVLESATPQLISPMKHGCTMPWFSITAVDCVQQDTFTAFVELWIIVLVKVQDNSLWLVSSNYD